MDEEQRTGMRLSTTSTTGWTHWHHGELWLFENGVLRIPVGPLAVGYVAEQNNPCTHVFSAEVFDRLIADPHNLWIPRDGIKSAVLRYSRGWAYDLRVQMLDGRSLQLLTLPWKRIYMPLRNALYEWLGETFVAKPSWWLRE